MLPQLQIHVDGHGSSFRTAERGYLRLTIACASTDQSHAFREAQTAAAKITTALRSLAPKTQDGNHPHPDAAVTAFTVTPLSTTSRYPRDQYFRELTSQPKEHTVSASAEAIFRDMARLAEVSNELATMPHVSVRGTEWRLTEATRVGLEREARLKAIRDAVAKARDYAGVVGREVVAVEIRDQPQPAGPVGGRGWGPPGGMQQMMQQQMQQQAPPGQGGQMAVAGGGGGAAAVASEGPSLEPKTITVSAAVTAKFVSTDGGADDMEVVQ
jgi:uncharacterized protein YggE